MNAKSDSENKIALAVFAHPDDAEFMCAGTLALLANKGWQIAMATMTPGDCGTKELSREEISRIRRNEAHQSAQLLGGSYQCLGYDDLFIRYDRPSVLKTIKLIRQTKPTIVFAPSPSDYLIDHEITSALAQTACFAAGIPNIEIDGLSPFESVPHLYYSDSVDGKDKFGNDIEPTILVDFSSVIDIKEKMLGCHASQRDWLQSHHEIDEYTEFMKRLGRERGKRISSSFAEGFRQHLGQGYPQENILKAELDGLVQDNL